MNHEQLREQFKHNITFYCYDHTLLTALEANGVDSWMWYDEALKGLESKG